MSDLTTGLASTANVSTPAPSAPSPSAAPASPSADSRPTSVDASLDQSFASMVAGGEPATPTPAPDDPQASTPAPATTEPPADQTAPVETAGPIPFDRHKAALENARTKATQEADQRFQHQYGGHLQVVHRLQQDLPGTLEQLLDEAATDPTFGPAVRAMLGRKLGGLRQRAPLPPPVAPADEAEPSLFVEQNGERFFDPAALPKWQAWNRQQVENRLSAKFEPLTQLQHKLQKAEAIAQFQEQSQQTVSQRLDFWKDQPGFTDHRKAIGAKQKELFEQHQGRMDEWTALGLAYAQVVPQLLQAKQTNQWVQDAGKKSAGSTANPVASAPAQPRKFRTPEEAIDAAFQGVTR